MAGIPDGSYALFRSDENKVELITDVVGSSLSFLLME